MKRKLCGSFRQCLECDGNGIEIEIEYHGSIKVCVTFQWECILNKFYNLTPTRRNEIPIHVKYMF